jgi:hypothetical protein
MPQDIPTCLSYKIDGMYPCNWSGGTNARCQKRSGGSVSRSKANQGKYGYYIDNSQMPPSPAAESPARIREMFPFLFNEYTPPASQNTTYSTAGSACKGLNERICKGNPNCTYTKLGCVRRKGTVTGGLVFEGPSLHFGKKRSSKRATKKLPAKIRKLCKRLKIKTTKRVGGRRVHKSIKTLMKQIRMRMKKMKKTTRRVRRTRCTVRS